MTSVRCKRCDVAHYEDYDKHFYLNTKYATGYAPICKKCRKEEYQTAKSTNKPAESHYKRTYGITLGDAVEMWESQGQACAACGNSILKPPSKKTHLDHSAENGDVRGVLCSNCNLALGIMNEDGAALRGLANYIDTWKATRMPEDML